jgi:hypothetical protein
LESADFSAYSLPSLRLFSTLEHIIISNIITPLIATLRLTNNNHVSHHTTNPEVTTGTHLSGWQTL